MSPSVPSTILYAPVMMAAAVKMLGAEREAQDLVHDVFLEAWLHSGDYDAERGSLRSGLLLRLRSRALDRLGTAEATRTRSLDEGDAPIAAWSLAPVIEPADRIGLREAVGRLEASVREVLELTYFRGLTAPAIAEQTNVPVGTVRSRLARGLRQLRAALDTSFTTAVLESDGKIDHTYFRATAPPCSGATSANEPVLAGDYFASGKASIDPGCAQIGTTATGSATATLPGAGPVGL